MRLRNISVLAIPALALAGALAAAPGAHADGACRIGASLTTSPPPVATASASGMVQIPDLSPRGSCEAGREREGRSHRLHHEHEGESGRAHTDN